MAAPKMGVTPWLMAGAATLAIFLVSQWGRRKLLGYSYGSKTPGVASPDAGGGTLDRDPANLVPAFADKVEILFQRLRAAGFDPMLNEGLRTPERGRRLQELGYSQIGPKSTHVYGAAADILSKSGGWAGSEPLWQAMGPMAEDLGLIWGGRWGFYDPAHVQAISTNVQREFRALNPDDRQAFVVADMGKRVTGVTLV